MNEQEQDLFFVNINDPASIRRNLLESSKMVIGVFKRYEAFDVIRKKKLLKMNQLKDLVNIIKISTNEMRRIVPKVKLKKKKKVQKDIKVMPGMTESQLDRMEMELADIENELGKLS